MKKIFTLLFFSGLMTAAVAQNSGQYQYQNNGTYNKPANKANNNQGYGQASGGYGQSGEGNNGYQQNSGYNQHETTYKDEEGNRFVNSNRYGNDARYDDRKNDRRYHDDDRYSQRAYGYEKRRDFERDNRGRINARISIRFGQPSCF